MTNESHALVARLTKREAELVAARTDLDAQIRKLTKERDAIDDTLRQKLDRTSARYGWYKGTPLVELKPWTRTTIDVKRLRIEAPKIAERYEHTNSGLTLHYVA